MSKNKRRGPAPELTPEEQILVAKWLTTSNLGMPEPKEPTRAAIESAYEYCAAAFYAEGQGIGGEYQMWLADARRQDLFVREQWEEFKTGVARVKAARLRTGDVYRDGLRKALDVRKRGAWVFVTYAYRVADERGRESFHRQGVPPVERLHVNKVERVVRR